jgi:hypothetical protein
VQVLYVAVVVRLLLPSSSLNESDS